MAEELCGARDRRDPIAVVPGELLSDPFCIVLLGARLDVLELGLDFGDGLFVGLDLAGVRVEGFVEALDLPCAG